MKPGADRPPRFRVWLPRRAPAAESKHEKRETSFQRGYDHLWRRIADRFRRKNPFCRFCAQEGRDTLADDVDHIIPARWRPDLKYAWKNFQSLCGHHHDNVKQRMETFAKETGQIDKLPEWCSSLEARPQQFRPMGR